ncbi:TetR family transcriptional regulator [Salinisphaera sp. PC39]|uniref:TetR family transcriptional regulator n=1 Tax=Salinisphaera sp. PC39 TaxID=1304156 RepID=UPI00334238A8
MARKTKSEAEATRDELLCAAERVFLERGVARATLEQIAADAGVTRGALYWHFENKADLFKAMLDRVQMPMVELVERLPEEPEERPFEALRHLCERSLRNLTTDPQYRRVYTILQHRCERVTEVEACLRPHAENLARILSSVEGYFGRPANREALHPGLTPRLAARTVHVFMQGLYHDWLRDPAAFDLAADSRPMLDALFRSLARR